MIASLSLKSVAMAFRRYIAATAWLASVAAPLAVFAQDDHDHDHNHKASAFPNMDIRVNPPVPQAAVSGVSAATVGKAKQSITASVVRAAAQMQGAMPGVEVKISPETGAVEMVSTTGALTAAAPQRSGYDIVKDYLAAHADVYGLTPADMENLHFIGESVSPGSGLRMVRAEQRVNGLPVFQSETRFIIDKQGQLIRTLGQMVPNATATASPLDHRIAAPAALVAAMATVGEELNVGTMTLANSNASGTKTEVVTNDPHISANVASQLVYFPLAPGVLVPAWSQVAMTEGDGDWYTLVDANSAQLLWRKNIRAHISAEDARFSVYVQADGKTPADSPSPLSPTNVTPGSGTQPTGIARTTVNMSAVQNLVASPNGWITDGGNTTTGNNTDAYLDTNSNNVADPGVLDNNGRPVGNLDVNSKNRDFLGTGYAYDPPPLAGNPEAGTAITDVQLKRGVVTHLFYLTNWYHDQLYALGFDEASGNFQATNFSGMGLGNDHVLAEAQDAATNGATGTNRNNANFATPPDGTSGRMQMYVFTGPTVDRDGSLDAEIVVHELTHGLSNRLIGNGSGLIWDVGGGMGEGWSDFYALSLLNNTNADDPNGNYATGGYATYKLAGLTDNYLYGIRRFPYSTNNTVNPLTWADVDDVTNDLAGGIATSPINFNAGGGCEVHNSGEIWCLSLWEMRSRIIADPAGANGHVPTGNQTALQIVTDAMKMTPASPSFIDARDALFAADMAGNAGANEKWIWQGFADRGLGYKAVAPYSRLFGYLAGHVSIGESFEVPYLDVQSTTVDDTTGNNNGALDPNEPVRLGVTLLNPWRSAAMAVVGATATLTSSTPGVVIADNSATYGAIAPLGTAVGDTFQFTVPAAATAGQALDFTITVTSSLLGTKAVNFKLRVGTPAGNGTPITYTMASSQVITDNSARGVFQTQVITDDLEIADLDFRVDNMTHTFVGDASVLLRGPNGLGTDLISVIGGGVSGGGAGDNLINTLVDDAASGDFLLAPNSAAPFTGSWKPIFNLSTWTSFGFSAVDPVGVLSRYNGLSTKGNWTVLSSDQAAGDVGTLNSWSIIVTPKAFTVSAYGPPEIEVSQAGPLSNGGLVGFGSQAVGTTSAVKTFTITNAGTATVNLTGIIITKSGTNGNEFSLNTGSTASSVAPGASTTFTVSFSPVSAGPKEAFLEIASNDSDENPFAIDLTGNGTAGAGPATADDLVISEFRLRGAGGLADEYVELYNKSAQPLTVAAIDASAGFAVASSDEVVRFIVPNGTVIPGHGHYLATGSAYSLGAYAAGDTAISGDIPDNHGLALFASSTDLTLATRIDAAGFSDVGSLYREGPGIPTISILNINCAFYRFHLQAPATAGITDPALSLADGEPRDTDHNAADFAFVDTSGTLTGAGQRLGAPGPQSLLSPIATHPATYNLDQTLADQTGSHKTSPNRIRDLTSDAPNNAMFGRLEFNRGFINNSGVPLTKLRFRVVKLTTFPAPSGTADLRPITCGDAVIATFGGPVLSRGTSLEQPPAQLNGGGWNSTLAVASVTTGTPLNDGQRVDVRFCFGIEQTGTYRIGLLAEASPSISHFWIMTGNTEDQELSTQDFSGNPGDFFGNVQPIQYEVGGVPKDVVTDEVAPDMSGTAAIGSFDLLRRGGAMSENSEVVFPGYLLVNPAGSPAVTNNNFQGMWKSVDGSLRLLARSGAAAPGTTGGVFDILPEVPAISDWGSATFYASLRVGVGDTTASNDTGVWAEVVGSPVGLVLREGDAVPGIAGAFVDRFATGVFATANPDPSTYRTAFPVTLRGSTTTTAMLLYEKIGDDAPSLSVVAQEGAAAPGTAETFGYLAGEYSDPARMDAQGHLSFAAFVKPSNREGIWQLKRGAGQVLQKVLMSGETAPGTSGATFFHLDTPARGSDGKLAIHAFLNRNGDNTANDKNDGIWFGDLVDGFTCIIRRGDTGLNGLPSGAKVGNLWGGWLNADNQISLRGWVDMNGDGVSAVPTDVFGIYTNTSGAMELIVKVGDPAPGIPGATFAGMDLPVNGLGGRTAFIGVVAGAGITSANETGVWMHSGGTLSLLVRTGGTITTTQGDKTIQKIDFPGTTQPAFTADHRWEQPVMDGSGSMVLNVTFTDGTTSQVIVYPML